ncbi:hypothetical protein ACF1AJ_02825 [Leifsonia sp. NPDC014704]|uniref:hypothetical protein n=1 Tax=Leifsonia sp. NPDC014704 TaxID=3364123 RepID=UPI0036F4AEA8
MTDPHTRGLRFWRNFAWMFAGVSLLNLVCGVVLVVLGTPTGWVNIALGIIFAGQAILYLWYYRQATREQAGDRPNYEP